MSDDTFSVSPSAENLIPYREPQMLGCEHKNVHAKVEIASLEGKRRFMADIKIRCVDCGISFVFLGLPKGLVMDGAAVSADCQEARLAICPAGKHPGYKEAVTTERSKA